MPYKSTSELPEGVRNALPARARRIFMGAVNGALKTYNGDEETAAKVAWSSVKKKFKKGKDGKWVPKVQEARTKHPTLQSVIETTRKLYDAHWATNGDTRYQEMVEDLLSQVEKDPVANRELLPKLNNLATPSFDITQRVYETYGWTGRHEHDFPGSLDHHIRMVCAAVFEQSQEYVGRWGHVVAVYPAFAITCWNGPTEDGTEEYQEYWRVDYSVDGNKVMMGEASPVDVLTIVVPAGMVMGEGADDEMETAAQSSEEPTPETPSSASELSNLNAPTDTSEVNDPMGAPQIDEETLKRLVAQAKQELTEEVRTKFPALYAGTVNLDQQWHTDPEWLTQGLPPPGGDEELVQTFAAEITQKEMDQTSGVMRIKGVATRGNVVNKMGQVYPTQVWQDNLPFLQQMAQEGSAFGEADHPANKQPSIDRTCLMFDQFALQGDLLTFEARILPTDPHGKNLQVLLHNGARVDISSRGKGSMLKGDWVNPTTGERYQDVMVIQRGFRCRAFDAVVNGASPGSTITDFAMQQANSDCEEIDMGQLDALSQQVGQIAATQAQMAEVLAKLTPPAPAVETPAPAIPPAPVEQANVQQTLLSPADVAAFNAAAGMLAEVGPIILERKRTALIEIAQREHEMPRQWLNAYRTHLEMSGATSVAELDRVSEAFLPTVLKMYEKAPKAINGAGWKAQQDAGSRPGPKTPNEMIEFMVSEDWGGMKALSDDDPHGASFWIKQDAEGNEIHAPDHIRTPRRQLRKILQNTANHVDGSWNGRAAMTAFVNLFQGVNAKQVEENYLDQVCSDCTTAVGAGGAPVSSLYIFPLIRKVFPQLIATELASVQPMDRPDGRIFFQTIYRTSPGVDSVDEAGTTIANKMATNRSESFSSSYSDDPGECETTQCVVMRLASVNVTAETKKLHTKWSIEELQDLRAYHNLDVAAELLSGASRQIALEWNEIVLDELLAGAGAGNFNYGTVNASGYTQKEWAEYLVRYLDAASNGIFKFRFGDATHVIAGPDAWVKMAASFRVGVNPNSPNPEMFPGLTLSPWMAGTSSNMKTFKTGFWAFKNTNKILVIRRGADWSDTPFVWAPFVDYLSPVVSDPETLTQVQGVMSRAAHQVVTPTAISTITIQPGVTGTEL